MLRRTIPALPFHIVLLLVALFNALAGVPLHEARHIQELVVSATTSATASDVDAFGTSSTASDEHSEADTHTTCAWCLTHALEAGLAHAPARQPPPPQNPAPSHRKAQTRSRPSRCAGRLLHAILRQPSGPDTRQAPASQAPHGAIS